MVRTPPASRSGGPPVAMSGSGAAGGASALFGFVFSTNAMEFPAPEQLHVAEEWGAISARGPMGRAAIPLGRGLPLARMNLDGDVGERAEGRQTLAIERRRTRHRGRDRDDDADVAGTEPP